MRFRLKVLTVLSAILLIIHPSFAYKVIKPEKLPSGPSIEGMFDGEHAPREATLISIGEPDVIKTIEVGETIFLAQIYDMQPGYRLKDKVDSLIPGSMKIPFRFWINKGDLFFHDEDTKYYYFAPKSGNSGGYFPGFGEVMSGNDTAGIRMRKKTRKLQWFVDNSDWNKSSRRILWNRRISKEEMNNIELVKDGLPHKVIGLKKIIYDGFYNNTYVFTLVQEWGEDRSEKEFRFNPEDDGETTVIMAGVAIQCLDSENHQLTYKITHISEH